MQVATNLLTSCSNLLQQANIRMCSHGLGQLVTSLLQIVNRLIARCQQTCFKLIISTGLLQLVSKSCSFKNLSATSLILTDLLQLDEIDKFVATC